MSDSSITVTRTIDSPVKELYAVVSNPDRHGILDGSGFIRGVDHADRITEVGQVFTMNMSGDHMGGNYKTDNHVVGVQENKLLAWKTAPAGSEPPGWQWVWKFESIDDSTTEVELTYDWSAVTDKEILKKVSFPLVSETELEDSLARLATEVA